MNTTVEIIRREVSLIEIISTGVPGIKGDTGVVADTFETVSKNIKGYPYNWTFVGGLLSTMVYTLPNGHSITKSFNYTAGVLTSITLSGDTPSAIPLTKTFSRPNANTGVVTYG